MEEAKAMGHGATQLLDFSKADGGREVEEGGARGELARVDEAGGVFCA